MAASAAAGPVGSVVGQRSQLPLSLPQPRGAQVVRDTPDAFRAALGSRGATASAYADTSTNTVHTLGRPDPFQVAHEKGHLLDAQLLTDPDRVRISRMLRAPAKWDADRGGAEWFADYYAAAATNMKLRQHRGRAIVQQTMDSYADLGPRRLQRLRVMLDRIAQRQVR